MNLLLPLLAEVAEPAHAAASHAAESAGHDPGVVLMHHMVDGPAFWGLVSSKHAAWFVIVAFVVIWVVRSGLRSYRDGQPHGIGVVVELLVLFVRDEIAEKNIGHDGRKFTPLLCSFFFILAAALIGLLPFSATSTGNIAVTAALATISLGAQQWAGISKYGVVGHFRNLIPSGIPLWLLPIMIPVELLGVFTKPFALMVRLFANMLAGHVIIATLLMLIPLMAGLSTALGVVTIPVSLGLGLFIMVLELLVALIQAFIFTLLSAVFIGMYAHPAH